MTLDDVVNLSTLLLTVVASVIALLQVRDVRRQKRLERFKLLTELQVIDSTRVRSGLAEHRWHRPASSGGRERVARAVLRTCPGLVGLLWWLLPRGTASSQDRSELSSTLPGLLARPEWMTDRRVPALLAEVQLRKAPDERRNYRRARQIFRRSQLLVRPRIGLADNLVLFAGGRSFDAPSFGLRDISTAHGRPVLTIGLGTYYEFIDTCLCYGYEAAQFVVNPRRRLALRQLLPLTELDNRHCQIGIVTLCILRDVERDGERKDYFLLHKRSSRVAESANLFNAIPGGTFQPQLRLRPSDLTQEYLDSALLETVVREFCEEVLDVAGFSELVPPELVRRRPEWDVFATRTYFAGMGFNPLNVYFEILSVAELHLDHPDVAAIFGGTTFEDVSRAIRETGEGTVTLEPFDWDTLRVYQNAYRVASTLTSLCALIERDAGRDDLPWSVKAPPPNHP